MFKLLLGIAFVSIVLKYVQSDHPVYWDVELDDVPELRSSARDIAYRLPKSIVPIEYHIDIELYFDDTPLKQAYTYDGTVNIVIQAVEENINQIVLHANVDAIKSVTLRTGDGIVVRFNPMDPLVIEPQYHFLRINTVDNLIVGLHYVLNIEYSSTMNETPLTRGIWRGRYEEENGVERIYATTHFQPYNARQAFPCWDEPLFKAIFNLHITRPERYSAVYSNTGIRNTQHLSGGRVRDSFYSTPRMSSYLLTFLVSETFKVIAEDTSYDPPIRIIARSNAQGLGENALNLAVRLTDHFDEYFDMPYSTLHPNLYNDHVASPDWASAGTENWGMVSYRELHLLIDKQETIMSVEHYGATLVSHELAHKWFGNLVTCFWWSSTWINEGFASYFGYIATHQVFPEYDMHEHFNSRYLQTSLSVDSSAGTVPLHHEVNTPSQITGHFGTISYSKGAAFLRMTANMITENTFRKACQYFLQDNKFEPTDQDDLYNAFQRAIDEDNTLNEYLNFNFSNYYHTWVNEPGYPIINVAIYHSTGEMRISQERFFLSPTANPTGQIYPTPITFSTQSNPRFTDLKPTYILTSDRATLTKNPGHEWVIFNNLQHGHYRVNYDEYSWHLISEQLLTAPNDIHYMNRAQIVDDVFALMRSERIVHFYGFRYLRFLEHETNYHVWNPAISGFTWLRNRLRHLPAHQIELDNLVLRYMENVIQHLGFGEDNTEESPTTSLTRQEILQFACTLGHSQCVTRSRAMFLDFKNNDKWVNPRVRRNVYVVGIRLGDEDDYRFLHNRLINSNLANDQLEMLRGLGATTHANLLNEYLEMTLTNVVRPHDKVNAFNYALLGHPRNAYRVLQFVKSRINDIRTAYVAEAPNMPVHSALSSLASYLNREELTEMEDWLRETQSNSAEYTSAMNAIASARNNIHWGDENANLIRQAVRGGAAQTLASLTLIASLSLFAMSV